MMVVVFPVPGPPVIINSPQRTASMTAFLCISSRTVPVPSSIFWIFFSTACSSTASEIFRSQSILAMLISI